VHASPRAVAVTVSASAPGRGVAQLFAGARRLAQAAGAVPGRFLLRPRQPLAPGRYVVRLRITGRSSTLSLSRTIRVR
jgi:hypothetical protein